MPALDAIRELEFHVVAQIIKAELVVRSVSNVTGIGGTSLFLIEVVHNDPHREPQHAVDGAHPGGVAFGQIIIHRHHVDALAFQSVQIHRQRCNQRLTLAGLHFRNFALVQNDAANQLHVEMPHIESPASGLTAEGKTHHAYYSTSRAEPYSTSSRRLAADAEFRCGQPLNSPSNGAIIISSLID